MNVTFFFSVGFGYGLSKGCALTVTVANSILLFSAQFLHLAKYNLGKVNLEAMLVSWSAIVGVARCL